MANSTLPKYEECSGCETCSAVCPCAAISMREDTEGFRYPMVDLELCVGCDLCVKKCPAISEHWRVDRLAKADVSIYAAWHRNEAVRRGSSSGGIFTALATSVLYRSGVVFGACFEPPDRVCHAWVECVEDLEKLRRSKYLQSEIGQSYAEVKRFLNEGRHVLFVGSPCQVAGLYSYLGSDHPRLITTDFVCHGVPSVKLLRVELEDRFGDKKSEINTISFRDKRDGWKRSYQLSIGFANGETMSLGYKDSPFHIGFLKDICLRPSCYSCPFKGLPGIADITLGDFWGISRLNETMDDDKGTSLVLTSSEKGEQFFLCIKDQINVHSCPFTYIENNHSLWGSVSPHKQRSAFFKDLDTMPHSKLVKKYLRFPNKMQRGVAKAFRVCRKSLKFQG